MAYDRVDASSYGAMNAYAYGMPPNGQTDPSSGSKKATDDKKKKRDPQRDNLLTGGKPSGNDKNDPSFTSAWASSAIGWGNRELSAQAGNRLGTYMDSHSKQPPKAGTDGKGAGSGKATGRTPQGSGSPAKPSTYSQVFGLDDKNASSFKDYKQTVQHNVNSQKSSMPREGFVKSRVDENLRPIRETLKGESKKEIGSGIARTTALGGMAIDGGRKVNQSYQNARARGESKLEAGKDAAGTAAGQAVKSAVVWEAGDAAYAIGKALAPVKVGGLPVGGIVAGSLGAVAANRAMSHVVHDPPSNPDNNTKKKSKQNGQAASTA